MDRAIEKCLSCEDRVDRLTCSMLASLRVEGMPIRNERL